MGIASAVLAIGALLGLAGFQDHVLWLLADPLLVAWALGFIARANKRAVWYRW